MATSDVKPQKIPEQSVTPAKTLSELRTRDVDRTTKKLVGRSELSDLCKRDVVSRRHTQQKEAGALLYDVSETASCVNGITKTQKCFPASRTQFSGECESTLTSLLYLPDFLPFFTKMFPRMFVPRGDLSCNTFCLLACCLLALLLSIE